MGLVHIAAGRRGGAGPAPAAPVPRRPLGDPAGDGGSRAVLGAGGAGAGGGADVTRTNELGQPIGEPVPGVDAPAAAGAGADDGPVLPDGAARPGPARRGLFAANARDAEGGCGPTWPTARSTRLEDYRGLGRAQRAGRGSAVLRDRRPGHRHGGGRRVLPADRAAVGVIEVGHIAYSPLLQRTPAATEAMYLMMRRVFDELGYRRYEWKCDALNAPSRAAAERLGFRFEGVFRQATSTRAAIATRPGTAIIDSEWPAARRARSRPGWTRRTSRRRATAAAARPSAGQLAARGSEAQLLLHRRQAVRAVSGGDAGKPGIQHLRDAPSRYSLAASSGSAPSSRMAPIISFSISLVKWSWVNSLARLGQSAGKRGPAQGPDGGATEIGAEIRRRRRAGR